MSQEVQPARCSTPTFTDALENQPTEMGDDGGMIVLIEENCIPSSKNVESTDQKKTSHGARIVKPIRGSSFKRAAPISAKSTVKTKAHSESSLAANHRARVTKQPIRSSKHSGQISSARIASKFSTTSKKENLHNNSKLSKTMPTSNRQDATSNTIPVVIVTKVNDKDIILEDEVLQQEEKVQGTDQIDSTVEKETTESNVSIERPKPRRMTERFYSLCEKSDSDELLKSRITSSTFSLPTEVGRKMLAVAGSSEFGCGLAQVFARSGYHVLILSRNPERTTLRLLARGLNISENEDDYDDVINNNPTDGRINVTSYVNGLPRVNIVFITVPASNHTDLPLKYLSGKILVDVSNRNKKYKSDWMSNAEYLQTLVPSAIVVKSLNTLSAYALGHPTFIALKENPTCGNEAWAVQMVRDVLESASLPVTLYGDLRSAKKIEGMSVKFFSSWNFAFPMISGILLFYTLLALFRNQLCSLFTGDDDWNSSVFDTFLLKNTYEVCGWAILTLLAATYLPGVIAGYIQLIRGTKYANFSRFLDRWLKARKQLGLTAMIMLLLHALSILLLLQSGGRSSGNQGDWRKATYMGFGVIGGFILAVQGISSIPSVSAELTWNESQFILSRVGWLAFLFSTAHVVFNEWNHFFEPNFECYILPSGNQISISIAVIVIFLKLLLLIPCVDSALTNIRHGKERSKNINPV